MSDTPETDGNAFDMRQSGYREMFHGGEYVETDFARKLERQRNQLQFTLNRIYHWIERRNQDGFLDSKSHIENLDFIWDRLYDQLENAKQDAAQADTDTLRALHERNEARAERDKYRAALEEMLWRTYSEMQLRKIAREALQ